MTRRIVIGLAALIALVAVGCAKDEVSAGDGQTIAVEMRDNAFEPSTVSVPAGEPIRFEFENVGKVDHEAILGDTEMQSAHEEEMADTDAASEHDAMGSDADMAEAITLEPGDTGELSHTFTAGEELLIGCHEPGHYADGMKVHVSVS